MSEILLNSRDVASRPWRPFAGGQGVRDRVLWQDSEAASYAGLLQMEPGTSVAPHRHRGAVHHLWVVSGECVINARTLSAGSYVFVPQGLEHAIQQAGPFGCTLPSWSWRPSSAGVGRGTDQQELAAVVQRAV